MDWLIDHLGVVMFVVMAALLFTGFPVAFILGGVSLAFGALGWALDVFNPLQFYNLLIRIWGYDYEGSERAVDDHIRKLRRAMGRCSDYIQTIRGGGYRFHCPEEKGG